MLKKFIMAFSIIATIASVLVYFLREEKTITELSKTDEPLLLFRGFDLERTDSSGKKTTLQSVFAAITDDQSVLLTEKVKGVELSANGKTSSFSAEKFEARFKHSSQGGLFGEAVLVNAIAEGKIEAKINDLNVTTEKLLYEHAEGRLFTESPVNVWTLTESISSQSGLEYFTSPQRIKMKGQVEGQISPLKTRLR